MQSITKKILMALSGLLSFGYIVGHMLGNLQIFIGQEQINTYAEALHNLGPLLWVIRIGLIVVFVAHIWLGVQLKIENRMARAGGYQRNETLKASLSSRTMIWTGTVILCFVVYHILHYTARLTDPRFLELIDPAGRYDVYTMVILGFSNLWISLFYILSVGLLSFHLSHGISSMFQTLGWNRSGVRQLLNSLAWAVALVVFLGFASVPVATMSGFLKMPTQTKTVSSPGQIDETAK